MRADKIGQKRGRRLNRANALAEMPPPWQSKVVIIKLYIKIFWLPLLVRLMTCLHALRPYR